MPAINYQQLRIAAIITETSTAKTFVLQPLNHWLPVYQPGQFLTLVFTTVHGEKRRSYSISSSAIWNEPLSITIKRVENGEFSRRMLAKAKVGDILSTSGISGLFLLPGNLQIATQFFFMAAGSGITPCYAMIKTLLKTGDNKLVLIYSNRSEEETIFFHELQLLEQQYPAKFKIHFLFSNKTTVEQSRLSNWLLKQLLHQYLVPQSNTLFYLCGPFEYMQMITITLLSEGIPPHHIHKENFTALTSTEKPQPPDKAPYIVTIHLKGERHMVKVQYPQTILAAAKASNIAIPYSCEAGHCGSCAATCIKGKTWMAYNEVLMDEAIARGRILCCQAFPVEGAVEIVIE